MELAVTLHTVPGHDLQVRKQCGVDRVEGRPDMTGAFPVVVRLLVSLGAATLCGLIQTHMG